MHITPNANWMAQAVGDPLVRPLTIERHVTIAQKTQAAPNAWKKYWNSVTTLMTVAVGFAPSTLFALPGVVAT